MKMLRRTIKGPPYQLTEEERRLISLLLLYRIKYSRKSQDRYNSVRDSVEPYAKSHKKILPPKYIDYVEYMLDIGNTDFGHVSEEDVLGYHNWKVKEINSPYQKGKKEYTIRACAFALILACKDNKVSKEIFNSKMALIEYSGKLFPLSGAKIYQSIRFHQHNMENVEKKHPTDYELAKKISKKHF